MKKHFLTIMVAILAIFTAQAQNYKSMPQNAKDYIAKHFNGYNISHYEKDTEILEVEHKLYITRNSATYKLKFDRSGNIKDIESLDDKTALPNSVLPVKITQHVKATFPKAKIIEWKKKRSTQVVELTNDMELIFNLKGEFMRIDD